MRWGQGCGYSGDEGVAIVGTRVWLLWGQGCGYSEYKGVAIVGTRVWL